ncbi:hypothetical protein T11_6502 [Trichinella zimbabwensis]|uniref:Uncharacterized protein n=1 Tax=Trichinella zimbabwensis TaxID=268475 RepID=A0A0V1GEA3_9BILA|nr:hypothetical protein T11_6502 [Trichinella zimbabwensis]
MVLLRTRVLSNLLRLQRAVLENWLSVNSYLQQFFVLTYFQ